MATWVSRTVVAGLALWATGGAFTLSVVGALAFVLVLAAVLVGLTLLIHELIEDPGQIVEERAQILAIIAFAVLGPIANVYTGTAAAYGLAADAVSTTIGQQIWALVFQVIGEILTLLGF